jgi:uncharacterized protein DUF4154
MNAILTPAKVGLMLVQRSVLLTIVMIVLALAGAFAQSPAVDEYQVKAAFLYNFAKFIEWAPGSFSTTSAPIRICVFGRNPFGRNLSDVTDGKTINGRKLLIDQVADLHVARSCHIIFISSSEKAQLKRILEGLQGADALTVSDSNSFIEQGGMIEFVLENDRVQFEVNRRATEMAGITVSSKLLSVAKRVTD